MRTGLIDNRRNSSIQLVRCEWDVNGHDRSSANTHPKKPCPICTIMNSINRLFRPTDATSGSSVNQVALDQRRTRAREMRYPSPLASSSPFAVPHERRGFLVPPFHGLLQPVDDLLGVLGMLSSESTWHNDTLYGLCHVEPRAPNGRVEGHHPMLEAPAHQIIRQMSRQIIQHQDDA